MMDEVLGRIIRLYGVSLLTKPPSPIWASWMLYLVVGMFMISMNFKELLIGQPATGGRWTGHRLIGHTGPPG